MHLKIKILILVFPLGFAQVAPGAPKSNSSMVFSTSLRFCRKDDTISSLYCNCSSNVVSCDFKDFSPEVALNITTETNIELELYGYVYPQNATRLCICNTPSYLHMNLTRANFLPVPNNLRRFDLYNLTGHTHFNGGFNRNFNGDLVMSEIAFIPDITDGEFGRGNFHEHPQNDDLKPCCSPVKISNNYKKPVLFMEHSKINHVETRGFNDNHLWSTVIMKAMIITNIEHQGIIFDSHQVMDVAVLSCKFDNASDQSIDLLGTKNLIIGRNLFGSNVHPDALNGISNLIGSNLVIFGNTFLNQAYLDFDASNIVVHHNFFDLWDYATYKQMRQTRHNMDRNISIRYNAAEEYDNQQSESLEFGQGQLSVEANIYGTCNCSFLDLIRDKMDFHQNWCYTGNVMNGPTDQHNCSIKLTDTLKECRKPNNGETDFHELCEAPDGTTVVNGLATIRKDITGVLPGINSEFVQAILNDFGSILIFKGGKITYDKEANLHSKNNFNASSQSHSKANLPVSSTNTTAAIVVVSLVTLVLFVVFVFLYRNKRRFFGRYGSYNHEELGASREVML